MWDKAWVWLAKLPYDIDSTVLGIPTSTPTVGAALANGTRLLMILVGMGAVVFMLAGAVRMVYSRGEPANVTRARETMQYAAIGLIVAISGYAIVTFITNSLGK